MPYSKGSNQLYTEIPSISSFYSFLPDTSLDAANNLQIVRKESAPPAALALALH